MQHSHAEGPSSEANPARSPLGARERNRADRSARVLAAASELFLERGYADTSTQQIADHASLPVATLFRYAGSKAELLMLVTNDSFRAAIESGARDAAHAPGPVSACLAILAPVVRSSLRAPELTGHFQRELTFGPPEAPGRAAGLALVDLLVAELRRCFAGSGGNAPAAAQVAAESLFASLHLLLVQALAHEHTEEHIMTTLSAQATLLAAGLDVRNHSTDPTRVGAPATGNEAHHD